MNESIIQNTKLKLIKWGVIGVVSLIAALILNPIASVPTGYRGVITSFGAIKSVEPEGITLLLPWEKLDVFSIRAEKADVEGAEGATSDQQPVAVNMTVRYSIQTNKVAEVFEQYSHDGDLSSYVQTATHEAFKAVTAQYTAPDLIAQRSKVSTDIRTALQTKLATYGAQVINIDMTGFSFSKSYMAAINEKTTQEQLRQAADNKLKTVESEQKQKVAIAEAEARAQKAAADGQAYATIANAKAQAEDIRLRTQALREAGGDYLELKRVIAEQTRAERWNGQLPTTMYGSAPVPFLNINGDGKK